MTIENQVVSLNIAKRLKTLGVKQKSCFWWKVADEEIVSEEHSLAMYPHHARSYASAFTVAELGEMLRPQDNGRFISFHNGEDWTCEQQDETWECLQVAHAENEADARGKMLIYLLENGLVKLPAVEHQKP